MQGSETVTGGPQALGWAPPESRCQVRPVHTHHLPCSQDPGWEPGRALLGILMARQWFWEVARDSFSGGLRSSEVRALFPRRTGLEIGRPCLAAASEARVPIYSHIHRQLGGRQEAANGRAGPAGGARRGHGAEAGDWERGQEEQAFPKKYWLS